MKTKSSIKSPLRYPGGKSRAVNTLKDYIPSGTKTLCSPFFGGGSLEIYCAQMGIRVYGYDYFQPLVDFWQWLLKDPQKLANAVEKFRPLKSSEVFYDLQKNHVNAKDSFERAVEFYVLNRTSFSGSTLSGGLSRVPENIEAETKEDINPRFTKSSIDRIRDFEIENLSVKFLDFKKSIKNHPNDLLYLDPPYLVESKLYGKKGNLHKGFDHEGLRKILKNRGKWILSYNDSETIRDMYEGFQFKKVEWAYGMKNVGKRDVKKRDVKKRDVKKKKMGKSQEILIISNDIQIK
jgi:DNA adenine methylase